jgi:hypothetical protein
MTSFLRLLSRKILLATSLPPQTWPLAHPSLRWWSLTFGEARDFMMRGLGSGRAPARERIVWCVSTSLRAPSLSAKNIRRLGERFCNLSEEDLSDIALKKKKNPSGCVGSDKPGKEDSGDQNQDSIDDGN